MVPLRSPARLLRRLRSPAASAARATAVGWVLLGVALGAPEARAAIEAIPWVSGLQYPVFATAPAGDHRLFVVERAGRIRIVEDGGVLPTPFLDISSSVSTNGERGLLGLAFSPSYAADGLFYVYLTDLAGASVVRRFQVSANPDVADPASSTDVIVPIPQPFSNHNGGTVAFRPGDERYLYLAPGDGGSANDPAERSQNPSDPLGKMLRVDVTGALPAVPELWALGLRNPYRFSFDRQTGDLWIADVGQAQREEVNFEPATAPGGRNYGWDVMEGSLCNPNDPAPSPPCGHPSLILPVYEYSHASGNCSITGGFAYRGALPELQGRYFFGDYCSGRIWSYDPTTGVASDRSAELAPAAGAALQLVGFGEGGFGELFVVHAGGDLYRIRSPQIECSDGLDNDGDGASDFPEDPGCQNRAWALEAPACNDGEDDDGDGFVDFDGGESVHGACSGGTCPPGVSDPDADGVADPDPQCVGKPWRNRERWGCGLGFEAGLALLAWAGLRRRRPPARPVR